MLETKTPLSSKELAHPEKYGIDVEKFSEDILFESFKTKPKEHQHEGRKINPRRTRTSGPRFHS